MLDAKDSSSTRPYLIRALYEWCTDNGYTPFIAVLVDETVRVPTEFVKNGEIVLNISFDVWLYIIRLLKLEQTSLLAGAWDWLSESGGTWVRF